MDGMFPEQFGNIPASPRVFFRRTHICEIVQPTNALSQESQMNCELRSYFHNSVSKSTRRQASTFVLQRLVVGFAASLFFVGPCAFGQTLGSSGTIHGVVTDLTGAVVEGT